MKVQINAVVLTVSDAGAVGEKEDKVGAALVDQLREAKIDVVAWDLIASDRDLIARRLLHYATRASVNLIFTAGGTGLSPGDVTPEATLDVIERDVPGIPEIIRLTNKESTPLAVISRAVAGIRSNTLIVNLPGSVKGAKESFAAIERILPHAVEP